LTHSDFTRILVGPTIHCTNWPRRSHEDFWEVERETGADICRSDVRLRRHQYHLAGSVPDRMSRSAAARCRMAAVSVRVGRVYQEG